MPGGRRIDRDDHTMGRIARAVLLAALLTGGTVIAAPARPAAAASDREWNEFAFTVMINEVRASQGLPALRVHPVLVNKARWWALYMALGGCGGRICHSNLPDGITVWWTKLGENVGVGPGWPSIHDAFVRSPSHLRNLVDPDFKYVGVGVMIADGSVYVAEEFMNGEPPPAPPPPSPPPIQKGRAGAANPRGGYYVLSGDGTVTGHEGAPTFGSPKFDFDIARSIAVMPDGRGYVVLDGFGGLHRFGSAATALAGLGGPYWPGWDIARSVALSPDGRGYLIIDGFGGRHAFGSAPRVTGAYWPGWDIARAVAITPDGGGVYVLDGYGGVHASGTARFFGSPYFPHRDVARSLAVMPDGRGYAVLDVHGGIYPEGSAPRPVWDLRRLEPAYRSIVWKGAYLLVRSDGTGWYS